jgi:hypothetical protein
LAPYFLVAISANWNGPQADGSPCSEPGTVRS